MPSPPCPWGRWRVKCLVRFQQTLRVGSVVPSKPKSPLGTLFPPRSVLKSGEGEGLIRGRTHPSHHPQRPHGPRALLLPWRPGFPQGLGSKPPGAAFPTTHRLNVAPEYFPGKKGIFLQMAKSELRWAFKYYKFSTLRHQRARWGVANSRILLSGLRQRREAFAKRPLFDSEFSQRNKPPG